MTEIRLAIQQSEVDQPGRAVKKTRSAEQSRARILDVARKEFLTYGLNGARVDRIAHDSSVNKNLIYHYFGSKDQLYLAVLEQIYADLRAQQKDRELADKPPLEAMTELVSNTFDHFVKTPDLIRLMSIENIHNGRNLKNSTTVKPLYAELLQTLTDILERGKKENIFYKDVDPVDLYLSISALAYFFLSNQHTLSWLLDCDLVEKERVERRRQHVVDMVLGYLTQNRHDNGLEQNSKSLKRGSRK